MAEEKEGGVGPGESVKDGPTNHNLSNKVSSLQVFPAYALYRYNVNRPKDSSGKSSEGDGNANESSVKHFLQKEATDGNFSLSVVTSSLNAMYETELREMMAHKLSRGTVYSGSGNIVTLKLQQSGDEEKLSALCYYCLLRRDPNLVFPQDSSDTYCSNEFVVCFLADADVTLDLFRPELDKYSMELLTLLDTDSTLTLTLWRMPVVVLLTEVFLLNCGQYSMELLTFLDTDVIDLAMVVKPQLESWPHEVMHYISRCIERLHAQLMYLIHAALLDIEVDVVGDDKQLIRDVHKFVDCCSLSELVNQLKSEVRSVASTPASDNGGALLAGLTFDGFSLDAQTPTDPFRSLEEPQKETAGLPRQKLVLTLCEDNNHCVSSNDCTPFCENWAQALVTGDTNNPFFLRQVIENFKLKAIQDMNTLKRLIRQAETDHYALYRSFVFLKMSGNGAILLQHAGVEHHSMMSQDAQKVLQVLHEHMADTDSPGPR